MIIVSVQHNGLGNMLFQLAFSRLLAESMGRQVGFVSRHILREEGPMVKALPPHSFEGWKYLQALMGSPSPAEITPLDNSDRKGKGGRTISGADAEQKWCSPLVPIDSEYYRLNESTGTTTTLMGERPADGRRVPPLKQLA